MKTGQKLLIAAVACVLSTLFLEFLNVQHYFNLDIVRYAKLLFFGLTGQWGQTTVFYQEFVEQFALLFLISCEVAAFFFIKRRID